MAQPVIETQRRRRMEEKAWRSVFEDADQRVGVADAISLDEALRAVDDFDPLGPHLAASLRQAAAAAVVAHHAQGALKGDVEERCGL